MTTPTAVCPGALETLGRLPVEIPEQLASKSTFRPFHGQICFKADILWNMCLEQINSFE